MKNKTRGIGLLLSMSLLMSMPVAANHARAADEEQTITFGSEYSFDKFTLSYKDPTTAKIKVAFSDDGTTFGEYSEVDFSNEASKSVYLDETVNATCARFETSGADMPKINLEQITRYAATKDNVGSGTRGIEGNTKSMWSPGAENFAQFFDGTYDDDGSISSLGQCGTTGLYHDAIKDGKTTDKSLAMVELPFVFDEPMEFAYAVIYMDASNTADFYVRIPDKEAENRREITKDNDFGDQKIIASASGDKHVYEIKVPICDQGEMTNGFEFYWHNFHNYSGQGSEENARVDMPEMAFYYYHTVYESEFVLHTGAEYTFDEPITCSRIVGRLPNDMWYVGVTADGDEVDFHAQNGVTGYFAEAPATITKIKIRGYNSAAVNGTKMPSTLKFYGDVKDLAKAAYESNNSAVTVEGKAADADFGADTRAAYMSVEKETGVAALFDGDKQYTSIHPYHTFVDADKDRLTLKANSSVTVDLGKDVIIDTVSYYAGPQYTPKKYSVYVSDSADFSEKHLAVEKSYNVAEGRLSPFINDYGPYYCAMHEDQPIIGSTGRYIKIVNDGVLKPESDKLTVTDGDGNVVVDTVMKNDAMMNKNVILAKELRVMGAELVKAVQTSEDAGGIVVTHYYNSDNTVKAGSNSVKIIVDNETDSPSGKIAVYIAVYNSGKVLKSVKADSISSVNAGRAAEKTISGIEAQKGDSIAVFAWNDEMRPFGPADREIVQ